MGTFNLSCLQYRPIKRMLFTEWTHPNKIAYNMETNQRYVYYSLLWTDQTYTFQCMDSPNVYCLEQIHIKLMYKLNLRCLHCGAIKLTLFIYPFSYLSCFSFPFLILTSNYQKYIFFSYPKIFLISLNHIIIIKFNPPKNV